MLAWYFSLSDRVRVTVLVGDSATWALTARDPSSVQDIKYTPRYAGNSEGECPAARL
jgi:hypothetical protein